MKPAKIIFVLGSSVIAVNCSISQAGDFDIYSTQSSVSVSPTKSMITGDTAPNPCTFGNIVKPLDLLEVVERAMCYNPKTRQAWANVKLQAAQVGIGKAAYLPTMDATISRNKGNNDVTQGNIPGFKYSYESTLTTRDDAVTLNWVLFDFGLRRANLENARQLLIAANSTLDAELQTVFADAAQAYYELQSSEGVLNANEEAEKSAKESFMAAEAKYNAGVGALADKLQAQTTYDQAILNRVKANGELRNARGTLAVTMGLEANTPFALEVGNTVLPNDDFAQSVDSLIRDAQLDHPGLIAAQAQLKAAQANVSAVRAEGLPRIILTAGTDKNSQLMKFPGDTLTSSKSAGIQIKIPLFEGFSSGYRVEAAEAQVESKKADLDSVEQQISLDVWKGYQSLNTETENLRVTEQLVNSAEQSYGVARGRYKAGVGNILELLNSQSALANARQQRIQALSNWRIARLKLAASLGKLGVWAIR